MYDKILQYFKENEDVFNACIEDLDSWNGYLGYDRYYPMEEMNELFSGQSVEWILARAFFGHDEESWSIGSDGEKEYGPFNPCRDYFSFNGYGNFVSADCKDYSCFLDEYFVRALIENRGHLWEVKENEELSALLDEVEEEEV